MKVVGVTVVCYLTKEVTRISFTLTWRHRRRRRNRLSWLGPTFYINSDVTNIDMTCTYLKRKKINKGFVASYCWCIVNVI